MTDLPKSQQNRVTIWQKFKVFAITISAITSFAPLYWGIIWKILFALAVISINIWGNNNWYEQLAEAINKWMTGTNVDISKEVIEHSIEPHDLKKYIPDER